MLLLRGDTLVPDEQDASVVADPRRIDTRTGALCGSITIAGVQPAHDDVDDADGAMDTDGAANVSGVVSPEWTRTWFATIIEPAAVIE